MIIIFSLDLPNLFTLFILLILYMFFNKFDLISCIIFILVRQNQLTFCHLYLESYCHCEISVTFYTTDAY